MGGIERAEHDLMPATTELDSPQAPALVVGSAFDPAEREAEQVAETVLARLAEGPGEHAHVGADPGPATVRRETSGAASAEGGAVSAPLAAQIQGAQGTGSLLPAGLRRTLEGAMGADLGAVRVHTGPAAAASSAAIGAMAYTTGQDIFFGSGQFAPDTEDGLRTIAHEVTHTLQNSGGAVQRRIAGALQKTESLGGSATVVVKQKAPKGKGKADDGKDTGATGASSPDVAADTPGTDVADDAPGTDVADVADEKTTDEPVTDETATAETASDEKTTDETATAETASDEKTTAETASDEKTTAETASDEKATAETASDEKATAETASDEKATAETASDEKASDEKASDEKVSDDTATTDSVAETKAEAEQKDGADTANVDAAETQTESDETDVAADEKITDETEGAETESAETEGAETEGAETEGAETEGAETDGAAATGSRRKLSAWDRIINGLTVYERHESLLKGHSVDAHLALRGTLMADRAGVESSVKRWRSSVSNPSSGRKKAVEELSRLLDREEKLIEDGDPSKWLESFGFRDDEDAYGDDSDDSDLMALLGRHGGGGSGDDTASAGPESDEKTDDESVGAVPEDPAETKAQDDAAERIDEIVPDEVEAKAKIELGPDGLHESVVENAVEEVKDADTETPGPDRTELQSALAKLQVVDAIVGRVEAEVESGAGPDTQTESKDAEDKDAGSTTDSGLPAVLDERLAAAVVALKADDVKDALDGLLPERVIEATLQRLENVQNEIKDAVDAAGPDTEPAGAAGAVGAAGAPAEDEKHAEYLREMGVASPEELKEDVDGVVDKLFDGFGGALLRPGLGKDIEDLPEPVFEGLLEAMALEGGPNDIITAYLLDNRIADDMIQDVVEAALSAYLDKRIFENFVRWAAQTTMPIVTLASTTLNSGFDRRFANDVVGVGLS